MSSFDKSQAQCIQRALDIKECSGELLWQRRYKQDSSATTLKEIISFLCLIMSSNFRERARYQPYFYPFLFILAATSYSEPSLFRLTSVISLGFQLHPLYDVKCLLCHVLGAKRYPDHDPSPQVTQRQEETDRCMFIPNCSYYQ